MCSYNRSITVITMIFEIGLTAVIAMALSALAVFEVIPRLQAFLNRGGSRNLAKPIVLHTKLDAKCDQQVTVVVNF